MCFCNVKCVCNLFLLFVCFFQLKIFIFCFTDVLFTFIHLADILCILADALVCLVFVYETAPFMANGHEEILLVTLDMFLEITSRTTFHDRNMSY